jgi:hypothetical protein
VLLLWTALFDGGICKAAASRPQVSGGTLLKVADTWHLAVRPGRWAGHAPGYSHLALGLPSLGHLGCLPVCWADQHTRGAWADAYMRNIINLL